jgi:hypothetical protein
MALTIVPEVEVWRDEVNAACIAKLEEALALAKTTGLTGFAIVWTEKARAATTAYTITDERFALIGAVADLQHRIITHT